MNLIKPIVNNSRREIIGPIVDNSLEYMAFGPRAKWGKVRWARFRDEMTRQRFFSLGVQHSVLSARLP